MLLDLQVIDVLGAPVAPPRTEVARQAVLERRGHGRGHLARVGHRDGRRAHAGTQRADRQLHGEAVDAGDGERTSPGHELPPSSSYVELSRPR